MTLHPEALPPTQQQVLRLMGPPAGDEITDPLRLAAELQDQGVLLTVRSSDRGTLHAEARNVLLSFLEYRYPLLRPAVEWPDFGCRLASLEDLACMKLSAIASRGAKKDFIDLYAFGKTRLGVDAMLDLYREKYQTRDIGHVVFSLTYFDDAEPEDMPEMLWEVRWEDIKRTVEEWVRALPTK